MGEELTFPSGVREVILGDSFREEDGGLCTIKYDFKPETEELGETADIEITNSDQVTVFHTNVADKNATHIQYKGCIRPCEKEYVMIIDHDTNKIYLERLSSNIQLKRARADNTKNKQKSVKNDNNDNRAAGLLFDDSVKKKCAKRNSKASGGEVSGTKFNPVPGLFPTSPLRVTSPCIDSGISVGSKSCGSSPRNPGTSDYLFQDDSSESDGENKYRLQCNKLLNTDFRKAMANDTNMSGSSNDSFDDSSSDSDVVEESSSSEFEHRGAPNGNTSQTRILDDDLKLSESEYSDCD